MGGAPQTPPPPTSAVRASPKSARPRWARRTERHSPRAPPSPACPGVYGATPLRRPAGPTPRPEPAPRPGKGAVGPAGRDAGRRAGGDRELLGPEETGGRNSSVQGARVSGRLYPAVGGRRTRMFGSRRNRGLGTWTPRSRASGHLVGEAWRRPGSWGRGGGGNP